MFLRKMEKGGPSFGGPSRQKPIDSSKSDINILLFGETGVGKSTFINSFANYIQYETFETALESELVCLIPTKFTIPDEDYKDRYVEIGSDKNEDQKIGNSSTQGAKSYVFPIDGDKRKIRLIDTPGIGDARGITQDNLNFENVLDFISQYDYLHAICFLLKPNVSIITAYFKFCLLHLLMRLEKSAVRNVIFVFTNTRSTLYRPSETLTILREILADVENNPPNVKIPCDVHNIFCVDNEAFRFLVALKNDFKFSVEETANFSASWDISVNTCKKLLDYVAGKDEWTSIKPHLVKNTNSVNDARRIVSDLSKSLVDISDLIQDNLTLQKRHERNIARDGQSIEEFKKHLFVPVVHIKTKDPVTVCASVKCIERIGVGESVMCHYKQICHSPCNELNVRKEHIGAKGLLQCKAMQGTQSCIVCKCPFGTHKHTYYKTKKVDAEVENQSVRVKIDSAEHQIRVQREYVEKLQTKKAEYEEEKNTITKSLAKFAHFLKDNSISIFDDAYEDYLDYLITREIYFGKDANKEFVDGHVALKKQYQQEKKLLDAIFLDEHKQSSTTIRAEEIHALVSKLYELKHTGKKIKELHKQSMRQKKHDSNTEYYHPKPIPTNNAKALHKSKKSQNDYSQIKSQTNPKVIKVQNQVTKVNKAGQSQSFKSHTSKKAGRKLVDYIAGKDERTSMKPHLVKTTSSVNDARRVVTDLSKPLVDISDLLQGNLISLQREKRNIAMDILTREKDLPRSVTACTSAECSERIAMLKLESAESQIKAQKIQLKKLQSLTAEYAEERNIITKSLARFALFLKHNSISIFSDPYEDYLDYLIARDNVLGEDANKEFLDRRVALKKRYQEEKKLLDALLQQSSTTITAEEIQEFVSKLYGLRHTGKKIKALHEAQQSMGHPKPITRSKSKISPKSMNSQIDSSQVKANPEASKVIKAQNRVTKHNKASQPQSLKPHTSKPQAVVAPEPNLRKDMVMIKNTLETADLKTLALVDIENLPINKELKNELANKDLLGIISFVSNYFETL